jgi:hypothetical protein
MSNEKPESLEKEATSYLNTREEHAYRIWQGTDKPALAPSLNAKLFNLFLQGKTCEEIRRLNPSLQLGEIVAARIAGRWDERREDHLDNLLDATSKRVQQVTLETADFVCDILAVANREHGDKLRIYLQTGNPDDLGEFRITSLPSLKMAIETLQKLTGQDRQQTTKTYVSGEVVHRPEPILSAARPPAAAEAAQALKLLLGRKDN